MNPRQKGNRAELKAVKELESQGWIVYRVKGSTKFNKNVDMFGLWDLCARQHKIIKWVQVKSNKKPPFKEYIDWCNKYCSEYEQCEIWVHYDYKGFRRWLL